ncbi:MAG: PDZ domain-containing protein [Chitinophagales bacterium]|nr:PDZ domain-containing protein [Chitinophagales bacterium]
MAKILEKIDIDMDKLEHSLEGLDEKLQEFDIDVDVDIQGLDQMINAFEEEYHLSVDDDSMEKKVIRIKHAHKSDKGFLGVVPEKHENGVLIKEVVKGSGAEAAGIKAGDVITSVNGNSMVKLDDLYESLKDTKQGDKIKVKYDRDGKSASTKATLGEYPKEEMVMHKKVCVPSPSCQKAPDHGFLGVYMEDTEEGVLVEEVVEGSAAEKAGILSGDVLLNLDNKPVNSDEEVFAIMKTTKPGDEMPVKLIRAGNTMTLNATLGKPQMKKHTMEWKSIEIERPFLGVVMEDKDEINGVLIKEVVKESAAEKAGIKSGDIIKSVDNVQTNDVESAIHEIRNKKSGDDIEMIIDRNGEIQNISATLASKKFSHCGEEWSMNKGDFNIEIDEDGDKKIIKVTSPSGEGVIEKIMKFEDVGEVMELMLSEEDNVKSQEQVIEEEISKPQAPNKSIASNTLEVQQLALFPNPNNGKFKLTFGLAEKGNTEILILDTQGKEVYKEVMEGFSGKYDRSIDLSENSTGTYLIQISQNEKILRDRIIIQ